MEQVLVVIPVYNCERQISRVLDEFDSELQSMITKILVLDNQSKDNSIDIAYKYKSKFKDKLIVGLNSKNYSLGGSQKIGFEYAIKNKFEFVAVLHGDNQACSLELKTLLDEIRKDESIGAVLGSRFLKSSTLINYSQIRIFGNKFLNKIYSLATREKIVDLGSGLNIFRVRDIKKINLSNCSDQLHFNMDLLLEMVSKKISFTFLPITWREEDQVSNAKIFRVGWSCLKNVLIWYFGFKKNADSKNYHFDEYNLKNGEHVNN